LKDDEVGIESSLGFQNGELPVETEREPRTLETAEQLGAATRAKEEETARRLSDEESALLAEVEVLAREETELLTRLLNKERTAGVTLDSGDTDPVDSGPGFFEAERDFAEDESSQPSFSDNIETLENSPRVSTLMSPVVGDSSTGCVPEEAALDPEAAEPLEEQEFAPGECIFHLQHFPAGKVMAFQQALRRTPGLKIISASGTTAGIVVSVRTDSTMPLVAILSLMPVVSSIEYNGRDFLISGNSVQ
jgi:hypothetical protein